MAPSVSAADLRSEDSPQLAAAEVARFRSAVGKLFWLAHIRPDVAYLAKELARHVQQPCEVHVRAVKSVLRYLAGTRAAELRIECPIGSDLAMVDVWLDAS